MARTPDPISWAPSPHGLADIEAEALAGATRIAVPGCFATATMLSLWPLAPVLSADSHPVCWAATGSSGSGATAKATTHHPFRAHNFYGYSLAGHRHEVELEERLCSWCGASAPDVLAADPLGADDPRHPRHPSGAAR